MGSRMTGHFASTPVPSEAEDTCDVATINTLTSNTSVTIEPRTRSLTLARMADAPKAPGANLWAPAGSSWLTNLGGNIEMDHVYQTTFPGIAGSPVSTLDSSMTFPASSFPLTLLPSMSMSAPVSYPSAPSLCCAFLVCPTIPVRLTLLSTSTAAFPSSIDTLERWHEDIAVHMHRLEAAPQTPSIDRIDSITDRTERTDSSPSPSPNLRQANLRATRSNCFLQKVKRIGGHVRRFVTRDKRSKPHDAVEVDASLEDGNIIEISALPSHDIRPSRPIPHSPDQLRRSVSILSPHSLCVAYKSVEGTTDVSLPAPPGDVKNSMS